MNLSQREPNPKDIKLEIEDWIAECLSLEPDRSITFAAIGSSWDALCLIYLLSHIGNLYWFTDDITRKIAQKAYISNYEGGWEIVQEALEQSLTSPEQFYKWFLLHHSPEEFFGNLKRRAKRLLKLVRYSKRDPLRNARRGNRPRGYRDKGTYVPPHRPRIEPPEKVLRNDRRKFVAHPLLRQDEGEKEKPRESDASETLKEV